MRVVPRLVAAEVLPVVLVQLGVPHRPHHVVEHLPLGRIGDPVHVHGTHAPPAFLQACVIVGLHAGLGVPEHEKVETAVDLLLVLLDNADVGVPLPRHVLGAALHQRPFHRREGEDGPFEGLDFGALVQPQLFQALGRDLLQVAVDCGQRPGAGGQEGRLLLQPRRVAAIAANKEVLGRILRPRHREVVDHLGKGVGVEAQLTLADCPEVALAVEGVLGMNVLVVRVEHKLAVELRIIVPVTFVGAHRLHPVQVILVEVDAGDPLMTLPGEVDHDRAVHDRGQLLAGVDELGPRVRHFGPDLVQHRLVGIPEDFGAGRGQAVPFALGVGPLEPLKIEGLVPRLAGVRVVGADVPVQVEIVAEGAGIDAGDDIQADIFRGKLCRKPGVVSARDPAGRRFKDDVYVRLMRIVGRHKRVLPRLLMAVVGGVAQRNDNRARVHRHRRLGRGLFRRGDRRSHRRRRACRQDSRSQCGAGQAEKAPPAHPPVLPILSLHRSPP